MASPAVKEKMLSELQKLPRKKISPDRKKVSVVCPFHDDHNPSGTINLDELERRAPLGWFRCWSCGTSVPWKKFADRVGLDTLGRRTKLSDADFVDPKKFKDEFFIKGDRQKKVDTSELEFLNWGVASWRGFSAAFLRSVGCKYCRVIETGREYIFMPVKVSGKLRGYVKAVLNKKKGGLGYFNSSGEWSSTFGFLFLDRALRICRELDLDTIVLVEGPRDALRLIRDGIPAVAVLGALNWNDDKRLVLEQTGVNNLILMMDGDAAGKEATKVIFKSVRNHFSTKYMALWKLPGEFDPCDAPPEIIEKVRKGLR